MTSESEHGNVSSQTRFLHTRNTIRSCIYKRRLVKDGAHMKRRTYEIEKMSKNQSKSHNKTLVKYAEQQSMT